MAVQVNNIQDKIELKGAIIPLLENIGTFILRLEGVDPESELGIILVDNSYIQELNFTYRGIDSPTDVLAFNLQDGGAGDAGGEVILGDVIISLEKAREQSLDHGHDLAYELAFLTTHGILHLLGYDHDTDETEQEMEEKTKLILTKFKL
jgi:probable rRNA maturation factor